MANSFPKIEDSIFDWNDLKYAMAVARSGGLTGAANMLGTSASTVARHIRQLEVNLGQTLFLRQQSGYLLTDQGKEVLGLIDNVEQALLAVNRHTRPETGSARISGLVRIACSELFASHLIIPRLAELYLAHPDLQVELVIDNRLADLGRREADLAVRMVTPGKLLSEKDYVAHFIAKLTYGTYKSRHHEVGNRYIAWGQEWAHLPAAEWMAEQFQKHSPVLYVNSSIAQLCAVQQGLGVALLPRYVGDLDANLIETNSAGPQFEREIWVMYHRDLKASRRVQVLRECLTEWVRELFEKLKA
jgi:DNA-binding transcriptional LysR family regulator